MLNILRRDDLCENVHGYYWYYCSVGVTASSVGAALVYATLQMTDFLLVLQATLARHCINYYHRSLKII